MKQKEFNFNSGWREDTTYKAPARRGSWGAVDESTIEQTKEWLKEKKEEKPKIEDTKEGMQSIFNEAFRRAEIGRRVYGKYNPITDTRDMKKEAEEELLDCINYCVFQIIKLRSI